MSLRPFRALRLIPSSRMSRVRLRLRLRCRHKHRLRRRSRLKGKGKGKVKDKLGSEIRRIIGGCSLLIVIDFLASDMIPGNYQIFSLLLHGYGYMRSWNGWTGQD